MSETVDAVVIGGGPNGLVAANALADAGWSVVVLEANEEIGGAVRSTEAVARGFVTDLFSAFYPLAAASPVIRDLDLGEHGLVWSHAENVVAHVLPEGPAPVIHRRPADTAAGLDESAPGDGDRWLAMVEQWHQVRDPLLDALFTPFPPVRSTVAVLRRLGTADALDLARLAVLPVRRLADERFTGLGSALLLTGNAMHSDVSPDAAGSGFYGWLLAMLAQDVGFPVPRGGAGMLATALASRFRHAGGVIRTRTAADHVQVAAGRAIGVRTDAGELIRARHAVLADVSAPALYSSLLDPSDVPARLLTDLGRFQWDNATLKLNWALAHPIPWRDRNAHGTGTVHLGVDLDGFVDFAADLSIGRLPRHPFVLCGQMTTADPTRSPAGTESAWAYTHLPRHRPFTASELDRHVTLVEQTIETLAPGFLGSHRGRLIQAPDAINAADANLDHGAINGGTSQLHQQLIFRPTPGLGRAETPIDHLYLASAAAHPGGGVHGACGWNAARTALAHRGPTGAVRRRLARTAWARLLANPGTAHRRG